MNTIHIIEVCIALVFLLFSFYRDWFGASFTFLIAIIFLAVCGVLSPSEVLSGAANEQVIVIIMLLLIGDIIRQVGLIENIFDRLFTKTNNRHVFSFQMMSMVGVFSAFFNNTPLVAVMMPYVNNWSKRNNTSPSKLLIPLSYAAILGGGLTLIGTSTNLIVNGMYEEYTGQQLNMFDFIYVGLPMLIIGIIYLVFVGDKLLPNHESLLNASLNNRQYIVEGVIPKNSSFIGKTLKELGFIDVKGLFLFAVYRNDVKISIQSNMVFEANDSLFFTGDTEMVTELLNQRKDLVFPEANKLTYSKDSRMIEVVVSHNSNLISKDSREINFRARYNASLIAIHRNGELLKGKIRNQKLKAGDVLLLISDDLFEERTNNDNNIYMISKTSEIKKQLPHVTWLLIIGILVAVALSALHIVPIFTSLAVMLIVGFLTKISNPKDIVAKIDFNLGLTIILALAFGTAMLKTGVSQLIADGIIYVFSPLGTLGFLFALYILTSLLGAYITNKAAVAVSFPIAISMAIQLGYDPKPFVLLVSYAAAANFITPIGYQTNLMVYGPGNYTFRDFFKVGLPLTVLYMFATVGIIYWMYIN
ncbi:SLC13 family permease [Balneicella halophila]|nr:SLC13 family permease [Balneicella halophila]